MLIRCEKCSTTYELDDNLLPPQGAPVQCSKCQFVFKAYPAPSPSPSPPAPGLERLREPDVANEPASEQAPDEPAAESISELVQEGGSLSAAPRQHDPAAPPVAVRAPSAGPQSTETAAQPVPVATGSAPAARSEQKFTADGRPIRKVPFPTSDVPPPTARPKIPGGPTRKPVNRVSLLVPVAVIAAIVIALLAWWFLGHRGSAAPASARAAPVQLRGALDRPAGEPGPAALDDPARHPAPDPYAPGVGPEGEQDGKRAKAPPVAAGSAARN